MSSRLLISDLIFLEVAPPGRELQVRKLKGKVDNPYAVAWASYNAGKARRKKKESTEDNPYHDDKGKFTGPGGDSERSKALKDLRAPIHGDDEEEPKDDLDKAADRYLKRKMRKEANSSGGLPQTLRGQKQAKTMCGMTDWGKGALGMKQADKSILKSLLNESVESKSYRFSESNLMEVVAPVVSQDAHQESAPPEGPIVKCVLITEGLGNRADMHYYGPECINRGVNLFEGQPCFVDHQKRSEQQDQPERTVRDKCGYFKNVRAESVDGRLGLMAELHYDLSETGRYAYDKACTAIHYKTEFPDSNKEYVGLSIAADGKLEERVMQVGDEVLDVKYVTEFTAVGSVDEVTSPARGGRFVQVLSR